MGSQLPCWWRWAALSWSWGSSVGGYGVRLHEAGAQGQSSRLWPLLAALVMVLPLLVIFVQKESILDRILWSDREPVTGIDVVVAIGAAVVLVGLMAIVLGAWSLARQRHSWAVRAARTSWVVRGLGVATLTLTLATVASWPTLIARHREYWRAAAARSRAEMSYVSEHGNDWIEYYFLETLEQSETRPADVPATAVPGAATTRDAR